MANFHAVLLLFLLLVAGECSGCRLICREKGRKTWKKCSGNEVGCQVYNHPPVPTVSVIQVGVLNAPVDVRNLRNLERLHVQYFTGDLESVCNYVIAETSVMVNNVTCYNSISKRDTSTEMSSTDDTVSTVSVGETTTPTSSKQESTSTQNSGTEPAVSQTVGKKMHKTETTPASNAVNDGDGNEDAEEMLTERAVISISISVPSSIIITFLMILVIRRKKRNASHQPHDTTEMTSFETSFSSPSQLISSQSSPAILQISEHSPIASRTRRALNL